MKILHIDRWKRKTEAKGKKNNILYSIYACYHTSDNHNDSQVNEQCQKSDEVVKTSKIMHIM